MIFYHFFVVFKKATLEDFIASLSEYSESLSKISIEKSN